MELKKRVRRVHLGQDSRQRKREDWGWIWTHLPKAPSLPYRRTTARGADWMAGAGEHWEARARGCVTMFPSRVHKLNMRLQYLRRPSCKSKSCIRITTMPILMRISRQASDRHQWRKSGSRRTAQGRRRSRSRAAGTRRSRRGRYYALGPDQACCSLQGF
ncbi:uncharacterized protein SCHCODRAFT_02341823 [Schizophyllum commune H4-8]|uniref:uncharacterized protein n=1 Tax=Schizophyllum commune (strain H4-8 / FGSC 9210) TaxID=578458 RepID=UPI00215F7A5D|nr:uncharacterized protein SCHCODRAFT_02341823 [Schizophyllum commune H4-8]KAI5890316.1 hypothetical protein SCHCODRAFT_02341823 [Schizophyllum commune H4-8]